MCEKASIPATHGSRRKRAANPSLLTLTLGAALLALSASPAAADSFFFGFNSGYSGPGHDYGRGHGYAYGHRSHHNNHHRHDGHGRRVVVLHPPAHYAPHAVYVPNAVFWAEPRVNPASPPHHGRNRR